MPKKHDELTELSVLNLLNALTFCKLIAFEAKKNDLTVQQLAEKYRVHDYVIEHAVAIYSMLF